MPPPLNTARQFSSNAAARVVIRQPLLLLDTSAYFAEYKGRNVADAGMAFVAYQKREALLAAHAARVRRWWRFILFTRPFAWRLCCADICVGRHFDTPHGRRYTFRRAVGLLARGKMSPRHGQDALYKILNFHTIMHGADVGLSGGRALYVACFMPLLNVADMLIDYTFDIPRSEPFHDYYSLPQDASCRHHWLPEDISSIKADIA